METLKSQTKEGKVPQNLETAKPRIQFDMYKRLILWGHIWSFCFSASLLYLQAPDLVEGRYLFPLFRASCAFPSHPHPHSRQQTFQDPSKLGPAEQVDMWERERSSFTEKHEEEVEMAG